LNGFEYSMEEFARRAGERLDAGGRGGNHADDAGLVRAAVLVAVVARQTGAHVLLTRRAQTMPDHAGQIAFPGGKIEAGDADAAAAALREAQEETGLQPRYVRLLGKLKTCRTGTGFSITPVVGVVAPGFSLAADRREVDEIFEAPLAFLMNPANHQRSHITFQGKTKKFHVICYGDYYIWGATARMLVELYRKVYAS
jgi:8-oxo-dGTP pyrophosphatase MutT (NUDIX family)